MATLRERLNRGIAWTSAYQLFSMATSLIGLLVTSRLIPPEEFGLVAWTMIPLAALNGMAAAAVVSHSLFLPEDREPDWQLYFWLGLFAQGLLFVVCNTVAGVAWAFPAYRPMAPYLHVASIGFLLEAFVRIDICMSQRHLAFRRYQILLAICDATSFFTILLFTLAGFGSWGLILGNNVVRSSAFVFSLLIHRGWRPDVSRLFRMKRIEVVAPLKFAFQFGLGNAGATLRQFAEAALMPLSFTMVEVGLLSRAQGLFGQTAGRVAQGLNEAATPALPRSSNDPPRFQRHALIYHRVLGGLLAGCTAFLWAAGPTLSAVLYSIKWKAADPLLAPVALGLGASWYATVSSTTLLAAGKQRTNMILLAAISAGAVPGLIALALKTDLTHYAWIQSLGLIGVACFSAWLCRPILGIRRLSANLAPALTAALFAGGVCWAVDASLAQQSKFLRLAADVVAFVTAHLGFLRILFPQWLEESLGFAPKGDWLARRLGLTNRFSGASAAPSTPPTPPL